MTSAPGLWRRRWLVGAALVWHATLLALARSGGGRQLIGDEGRYLRSASHLLATGEGSTNLLWPPLQIHFLAGCLALGGGDLLLLIGVQVVMLAAAAIILRDLAIELDVSERNADFLAIALFAHPTLAAYCHHLWPEIPHLLLLICAVRIATRQGPSVGWAVALGAALGLALLFKSLLIPFAPVVLLVSVTGGRQSWPRAIALLAASTLTLALVISPALLRSWELEKRLVIADSSTFNLWVGLNERSPRSHVDAIAGDEFRAYMASAATFQERDEILRQRVAEKLRLQGFSRTARKQLGKQYYRLFHHDSVFTDELPGGALGRGYRGVPDSLARTLRAASSTIHVSLLILFVGGVLLRPVPPGPIAGLALLFLAYNVALFSALHVKSRYLVQMLPFMMLFAARALEVERADLSRRRLAGAAIAAALLSWLSLG